MADARSECQADHDGSLCTLENGSLELDTFGQEIKALATEEEREEIFINSSRHEKERVRRIRQARSAAEVIQRSWRNYKRNKVLLK